MGLALPVLLWALACAPQGKEVPCYLSTPDSPTALQPGKLYTATATWKDSGRKLVWSFRT